MANKQINVRIPDKLIREGKGVVESHNYRNIQDLILEGLRRIISEHKIEKEVEAIKHFQELNPKSISEPQMKDMAMKYGLGKFR